MKVKVEVKVNAPALGVDRALDAVFKRAAFRNRRKGRAGLLFAKSVAYVAGCRGPPMKANGQQSDKHTCGKAMAAHHTCPRPAGQHGWAKTRVVTPALYRGRFTSEVVGCHLSRSHGGNCHGFRRRIIVLSRGAIQCWVCHATFAKSMAKHYSPANALRSQDERRASGRAPKDCCALAGAGVPSNPPWPAAGDSENCTCGRRPGANENGTTVWWGLHARAVSLRTPRHVTTQGRRTMKPHLPVAAAGGRLRRAPGCQRRWTGRVGAPAMGWLALLARDGRPHTA